MMLFAQTSYLPLITSVSAYQPLDTTTQNTRQVRSTVWCKSSAI